MLKVAAARVERDCNVVEEEGALVAYALSIEISDRGVYNPSPNKQSQILPGPGLGSLVATKAVLAPNCPRTMANVIRDQLDQIHERVGTWFRRFPLAYFFCPGQVVGAWQTLDGRLSLHCCVPVAEALQRECGERARPYASSRGGVLRSATK